MSNPVNFYRFGSKNSLTNYTDSEAHTPNSINIVKDDDIKNEEVSSNMDLYIGDVKVSDVYKSHIEGDMEMPNKVGGIDAGTTLQSLKQKTVGQILDDLLFPTINASCTEPSITKFLLKNNIKMVGTTGIQLPSDLTKFNIETSVGTITNGDGSTSDNASSVSNSVSASITIDNDTIMPTSAITYTLTSTFAASTNTPKDNKGNTQSPTNYLTSSTQKTETTKLNPYYPLFWTSSDTTVGNNKTYAVSNLGILTVSGVELTFRAHDTDNNDLSTIVSPSKIITSEFYNTNSGKYETKTLSDFWNEETIDDYEYSAGLKKTYYKYTYKAISSVGSGNKWRFKIE